MVSTKDILVYESKSILAVKSYIEHIQYYRVKVIDIDRCTYSHTLDAVRRR